MGRTARIKQQPAQVGDGAEPPVDQYRLALLCAARSMVADMYFQPKSCSLRDCRKAGYCVACNHFGMCLEPLSPQQEVMVATLIMFHDFFFSEFHGYKAPDWGEGVCGSEGVVPEA